MLYEQENESLAVLYDKVEGSWVNARPLSSEELSTITSDIPSSPVALLPQRMLWYEENKLMIWYSPPCKRKIKIKGKVTTYCHPGIVFLVRRHSSGRDALSIAVLSISEDKYPDNLEYKIYASPYRGIDVHQAVGEVGACNVVQPKPTYAFSLDVGCWIDWEEAFYQSAFNYRPKRRNQLKQSDVTLENWINAHIRRTN